MLREAWREKMTPRKGKNLCRDFLWRKGGTLEGDMKEDRWSWHESSQGEGHVNRAVG